MTEHTNPLIALSEAMVEAVALAGDSTVTVDTRRRMPASGIVYAPDLVLTADHVVERDDDLHIVLPDGSRRDATVAGRDPGSDLALLRIAGGGLNPARPADTPARVGQIALALGRPSAEGIQASLGVVSAIGGPARTGRGGLLEQYLRTDTIPYPGFSGGPLADAAGRILGLNTSGLTPGGMGLTIPTSLAWQTAASLEQHGHVRRGYLGVRSQPAAITAPLRKILGRAQETGLLLVGVEENSPAEAAGLLVGDILVGLGSSVLSDPDDLLTHLMGGVVGHPLPVHILRGGQLMTIQVTIGERK